MNVNQLALSLMELSRKGYGDQEIVAYVNGVGEPLEVVEVHFDEEWHEVSIALDY